MKILLIITAVVILILAAAAWALAGFVMTGSRQTTDDAMKWQSERYDTSFYAGLQKKDYTVEGSGNYLLHVQLLENPVPTDRYVIISHGYTDNHIGSLKYVRMYLDLGFNCVIYDLRGHGDNERTITTYGILEGQDLIRLTEDTRSRYPQISRLGLHGESLGAATTITSLKYVPEVDFAVADCGFSDIENVLKEAYRNAHVPSFLVDLADLGARIRYGYALKDMRPIDSLDQNGIPVLFLHGADDSFIVPKNSQDMYERTKGMREIHLIPGAGHAESVLIAPEAYQTYVSDFLDHLP